MSYWEVRDYLGELADTTAFKEEEILSLCRSCLKEIEAKLKPDADTKDYRIVAAAAALANYKLALKQNAVESETGITNFKAGDVSIEQDSKDKETLLEKAESYYEKKMLDIIPLCRDNSFAFGQIKVM